MVGSSSHVFEGGTKEMAGLGMLDRKSSSDTKGRVEVGVGRDGSERAEKSSRRIR